MKLGFQPTFSSELLWKEDFFAFFISLDGARLQFCACDMIQYLHMFQIYIIPIR